MAHGREPRAMGGLSRPAPGSWLSGVFERRWPGPADAGGAAFRVLRFPFPGRSLAAWGPAEPSSGPPRSFGAERRLGLTPRGPAKPGEGKTPGRNSKLECAPNAKPRGRTPGGELRWRSLPRLPRVRRFSRTCLWPWPADEGCFPCRRSLCRSRRSGSGAPPR